jgi:hypothetical protein
MLESPFCRTRFIQNVADRKPPIVMSEFSPRGSWLGHRGVELLAPPLRPMAQQMQPPTSYGVVCLGLRNQEALLYALLQRASFCEDAALKAMRVRAPLALAGPLALLRASAFNVCLSDRLCFDAGFGQETLFTCLRGPCGAALPMGHPAIPPGEEALPEGALVAPFQLINHLPNTFALVNKAGLIRSLYRRYKNAQQGSYAPHVFECV